jgi:hypothetical protein
VSIAGAMNRPAALTVQHVAHCFERMSSRFRSTARGHVFHISVRNETVMQG